MSILAITGPIETHAEVNLQSEQQAALVHGGDLDHARARFSGATEPWIDLSTGINPNPYPLSEVAVEAWWRLPQRSLERSLCQVAARCYGAGHARMIVPAPGTQALIQIVPRLISAGRVAVISPTYGEHAKAWRRDGHVVVEVQDLASVGSADVVVVVNPNNPTGSVTSASALRELAQTLDKRGGLLVVDEAFADVMPWGMSLVPDLPPSTIVLRSFGKTYGLAGLRLGFAIAETPLSERLRDHLGPWAVSGPAMTIGSKALGDDVWLEKSIVALKKNCRRLDAMLEACGCTILGGTPLFRLASHPRALDVAVVLGRAGIYVRQFEHDPQWLRFGLPGPEGAWQRLDTALQLACAGLWT